MSLRFAEGGRERVLQQALALSGLESAPRGGELLDATASLAVAYCGREDIPEKMEGAVAALLAERLTGEAERPVTSVRRGDTVITYASGGGDFRVLLEPFVRLRTPVKGEFR